MAQELASDARRRRWLRLGRSSVLGVGWMMLVAGALACVALFNGSARSPVTQFLLAMAVIVLVCNLLGSLCARLGQPAVVGEILGGLLLGSSGIGLLWPHAARWLFPPGTLTTLNLVAQLGLVTFMFLLGCELRITGGHREGRAVASITLATTGLPFAVGLLLAGPARAALAGPKAGGVAYYAFVGLALSITALPVLARILVDLNLKETRLGILALSCAAAGDGTAWGLFTIVLAIASGRGAAGVRSIVVLAGTLTLVTFIVVRPGLTMLSNYAERAPRAERLTLPILISAALAYAAATEFIGLHPVIGAFAFGVVVPRSPAVSAVCRQLEGFAVTVLLPVFFAGVGLNLVIKQLGAAPLYWLIFAVLLVAAVVTKFVASLIGMPVARLGAKDAFLLGALMNCRGVTEIVVATVGLQAGIIGPLGFTMFVLLALLSTLVTGPLIRALGGAGDEVGIASPD
jgi:Kef-type K+ transport system membrane component KefB